MATLSERNVQNLEGQHPVRKMSVASRKTSVSSGSGHTGPAGPVGPAHRWRKLSRTMSVAMGLGRRFSYLGTRPSIAGTSDHVRIPKIEVKYENTYRMKPDEGKKFKAETVQNVAQDILDWQLKDVRYDPTSSAIIAQNLTDTIKTRVKEMNFQRYKIIVNVYIGSQKGQGMQMASRGIWDSETDNFACATYTNQSLFCVAMIHGIYFE